MRDVSPHNGTISCVARKTRKLTLRTPKKSLLECGWWPSWSDGIHLSQQVDGIDRFLLSLRLFRHYGLLERFRVVFLPRTESGLRASRLLYCDAHRLRRNPVGHNFQ